VLVHTMCRVHFNSGTNEVTLLRLNKKRVDSSRTILYDSPNDLPLDIQRKVALLDVMGKLGRAIDDVGYKVAHDVYWVIT